MLNINGYSKMKILTIEGILLKAKQKLIFAGKLLKKHDTYELLNNNILISFA